MGSDTSDSTLSAISPTLAVKVTGTDLRPSLACFSDTESISILTGLFAAWPEIIK